MGIPIGKCHDCPNFKVCHGRSLGDWRDLVDIEDSSIKTSLGYNVNDPKMVISHYLSWNDSPCPNYSLEELADGDTEGARDAAETISLETSWLIAIILDGIRRCENGNDYDEATRFNDAIAEVGDKWRENKQNPNPNIPPLKGIPFGKCADCPEFDACHNRSLGDWIDLIDKDPKETTRIGFYHTIEGDNVVAYSRIVLKDSPCLRYSLEDLIAMDDNCVRDIKDTTHFQYAWLDASYIAETHDQGAKFYDKLAELGDEWKENREAVLSKLRQNNYNKEDE